MPLGLIVGEAVTNALRYVFSEGREGRVRVELRSIGGRTMRPQIEDDGAGIAQRAPGRLTRAAVRRDVRQQVSGRATMEAGRSGQGTAVVDIFPEQSVKPD
ncbi:sensor histidine kinase [Belnapia sp. T6]|uniref:Sensor histidine kinase n=1 Tax=Belnapia mucosa TaxID=2804532 RepID=A0ABS1UYP7_9PROT|nr:sensor histidine kinase [Belnapia mucosa]MBL6454570.1 sensor histidine kinase [Belnapia mucosa]